MASEQSPPPEIALAETAASEGSSARVERARWLERGASLGRYTVVETLGEGGMGVVHGAYDPDLDRKVALKLLRVPAGGRASDAARARLLREARAMAKLAHPNVLRVYEVGTVGGVDFVAMEFVDGSTLGDWLGERHRWRNVTRVMAQAGRGLAAAHRAGLVHRDFKPSNVLLSSDGRVLVTDFGLAQLASDEEAGEGAGDLSDLALASTVAPLTRTGQLVGTPAYMAPEQLAGERADERSDQFAFCVALYQGLYGERPFAGETLAELRETVGAGRVRDEPRGARVPAWLRRAVLRGLSVDPAARFPSMEALLAVLRRDARRAPRLLAAGGVLALTVAAVTFAIDGHANGDAAASCTSGDEGFSGVWDQPARDGLRARFARLGSAGEVTFDRVAGVVNDYAGRWKRRWVNTCKAVRVRHEHNEEDLHLEVGCLLDHRDRVRSLIQVLGSDDDTVVEHAVNAAQALPPLDACDDIAALRRGLAPPDDPKTRALVEKLRADLTRVEALQDAGQDVRARDAAAEAVEKARSIGYPAALAEALYRLGRAEYLLERPRQARAALDEALLHAEESGHHEMRARVLVAQVQNQAHFANDNDATRKLARRARAVVRGWGRDDTLDAEIDRALAHMLVEEGQYSQAVKRYQHALSIYQRVQGNELRAADVRSRIAGVELRNGDAEGALADFRKVLAVRREHLGEEHPKVAAAYEHVGQTLRVLGKYQQARVQFAHAQRFWDSPRGAALLEHYRKAAVAGAPRRLAGVVLDPDGAPLAGASITVGKLFLGDGRYLFAPQGRKWEERLGIVHGETDVGGHFSLAQVSPEPVVLGAEDDRLGRAGPIKVPAGGDVTDLELHLARFGTVRGHVLAAGVPTVEVGVGVSPEGVFAAGYAAQAGVEADGSYEVRVPAGRHLVYAVVGGDQQARFRTRTVNVRAGQVTTLDFDLSGSGVTVDVVVRGAGGAEVDQAQVFLFQNPVDVQTGAELNRRFAALMRRGTARTGFAMRRPTADGGYELRLSLPVVPAGALSLCTIPVTGPFKEPDFSQRLQANVAQIRVYCQRVTVTPTPEHQRIVVEVPAMKPLPEPVKRP